MAGSTGTQAAAGKSIFAAMIHYGSTRRRLGARLGLRHDTAKSAAAVTELCRTMGMMTLAEGVETEDQLRLLQASNCDEAQGYLLSPPRPGGEVAALMQKTD
jgi:EAL domain-containing protein (putative c-di-GMP-specific phosphodiesterase class I)